MYGLYVKGSLVGTTDNFTVVARDVNRMIAQGIDNAEIKIITYSDGREFPKAL